MVDQALHDSLAAFASESNFRGKGPLSVALVVTERARKDGLPLDPERLVTDGGGQVRGLGRAPVQRILGRHGLQRVLASEGGRTSRGSIGKMRGYVAFLNGLGDGVNLDAVEAFWIGRVRKFFAGQPLKMRLDPQLGIQALVRDLIDQAAKREMEFAGRWYVGALIEHLVGAVIDCGLGNGIVAHHSSSAADLSSGRSGDFRLGNTVIHVTTSPGEAVVERCARNLADGLVPVLVVRGRSVGTATDLANRVGIDDRVDVLSIEQVVSFAVLGLEGVDAEGRKAVLSRIVKRYNEIVDEVDTDPSLKIRLG